MALRLTRLSTQAAQQSEAGVRLSRLSVAVAVEQITIRVRLSRFSAQAAQQSEAGVRLTQLSALVAIGVIDDGTLRGPRRSGVIARRRADPLPRV